MKCVVCQADTEVLETRLTHEGLCIRRKRQCVNKDEPHKFYSEEFSSAILSGIASHARIKDSVAQRLRGFARRAESQRIRAVVSSLAVLPLSNVEIAEKAKCSATRVRQIRKELDL